MHPDHASRVRVSLSSARRIVFLAVVSIAAFVSPARSAEPCPTALVHAESFVLAPPFEVVAAAWDTTIVNPWTTHVRFERKQGTMSLVTNSGGRARASLHLDESFEISGVPAGNAVPGVLELKIGGFSQQDCLSNGCGVVLEAALVSGADVVSVNANQLYSVATAPIDTMLTLPVVFVSGVPTDVQFQFDYATGPGQGQASAELHGWYRVTGLPPDAVVTNCAGIAPTPTARSTWGSLKSRYR